MAELPDDFADNPTKYDHSIETLAGAPDGPAILDANQKRDSEYDQMKLENEALRQKWQDQTPRHELFEEIIDEFVSEDQAFLMSEEGEAQLRQYHIDAMSQPEKERSSHDIYAESFQSRKKREYREKQEREAAE